ncbi:MAG: hypothetical protein U5N58_11985 [Actinomycetota bacterium]|nr:hypothetical protein [Actinomycetota bacterium]
MAKQKKDYSIDYRKLFDESLTASAIIAPDRTVIDTNQRFAGLCQQQPEEIIGKRLEQTSLFSQISLEQDLDIEKPYREKRSSSATIELHLRPPPAVI